MSSITAASTPASLIAAFMTCADSSTGCTEASAPSFFPLPTALRTALTRYTSSMFLRPPPCGLIPQRFSGLEHVLDPRLRFLCPEQFHESFTLEIEDVLLGHRAR